MTDELHERIAALEAALRELVGVPDQFAGWESVDGAGNPVCGYCKESIWYDDSILCQCDHTDNCPVKLARELLDEGEGQ